MRLRPVASHVPLGLERRRRGTCAQAAMPIVLRNAQTFVPSAYACTPVL